jgi:HEPN domain-containing protein
MISTRDLRAIARARLRDAQVLLKARRFDGAFYLSGYAVELALKARICRTLKWREFPQSGREFEDFKSLRTHDLEVLLKFSGFEERVTAKALTEWSLVAKSLLSKTGTNLTTRVANGGFACPELEF